LEFRNRPITVWFIGESFNKCVGFISEFTKRFDFSRNKFAMFIFVEYFVFIGIIFLNVGSNNKADKQG